MWKKASLCCVLVALLIVPGLMLPACGQEDEEEEKDKYETIAIEVIKDELYDLPLGSEIGLAKFRQKKGATGSRVDGICFLETLSRFPDQKVNVKVELLNQDTTLDPYEPIEWVQDTNEETFYFVIPLVETIPTILNFRVLVHQYVYEDQQELTADDDTADDDMIDDDLADDDVVDDDVADDDAADDDAADDDAADDDTAMEEPDRIFEAEAIFLFVVDKGQPGIGD